MDITPRTPRSPLVWSDFIHRVAEICEQPDQIYLVGGIVRDALRRRPGHDIDMAVPENGLAIARRIADRLGGAYFPIDRERGTGRIIVKQSDATAITIDIATFRGADLAEDLELRDFTVNAMATRLDQLDLVIDPLSGQSDLFDDMVLRQCHPASLVSDPIRAIRAVRLAQDLGLRIEPETKQAVLAAAEGLATAAGKLSQPERARDEFFKILSGPKPSAGLRLLNSLSLLQHLVPFDLDDTELSSTLAVSERAARILSIIRRTRDDNTAADLTLGIAVMILDRYREQLNELFDRQYGEDRVRSALLFLSLLSPPNSGPGASWKAHLRLTNEEAAIIDGLHKAQQYPAELRFWSNDRALHRYFRTVGEPGVDAVILMLAKYLANHWPTPDAADWGDILESRATPILAAYFRRHQEVVSPPPLAAGEDIIFHLKIEPGPIVGFLFDRLLEEQAAGEIGTKKQALRLAERLYAELDER